MKREPGALIVDPQNKTTPIKFFVSTEDGRLFEHHWSIPAWRWLWKEHGMPDGTRVATAPSALLTPPASPIKFFLGTEDGRLFERYWDQGRNMWDWTDHGQPPGTRVVTAPGALLIPPASPIKFFLGTEDGRLFERYWDQGRNMWDWTDHGFPTINGIEFDVEYITPGALIVDPLNTTHPIKFFIIGWRRRFASKGELRPIPGDELVEHYWDIPSQQWQWMGHYTPTPNDYGSTLTAPSALIVDRQNTSHPFKFFVGAQNGHLFEHHWDIPSQQWVWNDHGIPVRDGTGLPLQSQFSGTANIKISTLKVDDTVSLSFEVDFSPDHTGLSITSFPSITTPPITYEIYTITTTVTRKSGGTGTYDPSSGHMSVQITLHFSNSISPPVPVGVDADLPLDLRTDVIGGSALDRASGKVTLVGTSKLKGQGIGNPLDGRDCTVAVSGTVLPIP